MPEIPGQPGWHSTDGRDRPTPEFEDYAARIGGKIVYIQGTLTLPRNLLPPHQSFKELLDAEYARVVEQEEDHG